MNARPSPNNGDPADITSWWPHFIGAVFAAIVSAVIAIIVTGEQSDIRRLGITALAFVLYLGIAMLLRKRSPRYYRGWLYSGVPVVLVITMVCNYQLAPTGDRVVEEPQPTAADSPTPLPTQEVGEPSTDPTSAPEVTPIPTPTPTVDELRVVEENLVVRVHGGLRDDPSGTILRIDCGDGSEVMQLADVQDIDEQCVYEASGQYTIEVDAIDHEGNVLNATSYSVAPLSSDVIARAADGSAQRFRSRVETARVASGISCIDALLASDSRIPVLLVQMHAIPQRTRIELERLAPELIQVVGGDARVSDDLMEELRSYASGGAVAHRLYGPDRIATALAVSQDRFPAGQVADVYVVAAFDLPDALVWLPLNAVEPGPLLLVKGDELTVEHQQELRRLDASRIRIIGGSGVVSETMRDALEPYASQVERIGGRDRVDTAVAVSQVSFGEGAEVVFLSTLEDCTASVAGLDPSALSAGPILFTNPESVPEATKQEFARLGYPCIVPLGSMNRITDLVLSSLDGALCE